MLAYLRAEGGGSRVRSAIEDGAIASWVNLGEALYIEARRQGFDRADRVVSQLAQQLLLAEQADARIVRAAAAIKAGGGLSYADGFAIATAERHGLTLLTGDPEIIAADRPRLELVDLRGD